MKNLTRYSQNFLRDPQLVKTLLSKTNLGLTDTVYDIGGGKGIIASALAEKCQTVISVEIDASLAAKLRENLKAYTNAVVYEADFLSLPLPQTPYKVFSNIPFNLSADIVRKLTDTPYPPATTYLIVQKEFAEKLVPKADAYNSQLSVTLGAQFAMRIVHRLQPNDFYPKPKVNSTLLEVLHRPQTSVATEDLGLFKDFVSYAYNACKPSVGVSLSHIFSPREFEHVAEAIHCSADATPTQLNLEQWLQLFGIASQKRSSLERLVSGYEKKVAQRHSKRTKLHRTRF